MIGLLATVLQVTHKVVSFGKRFVNVVNPVDNYAKDGGPGDVWLLCSFYHNPKPIALKSQETSITLLSELIQVSNER